MDSRQIAAKFLQLSRRPFLARYRHLFARASLVAWSVLALFLLLTFWMVTEWRERERLHAQEQFETQVQEVMNTITFRMRSHEQILIGAAALFDASDHVDRQEWRRYVSRLALEQHYPGIQAVAFSQVIQPEELADHIAQIRAEGFPYYEVMPSGSREFYTSIIYIEPFSGRNLAAFGYDMYSEPVRRAAMRLAVEENSTRISGKVTLVQENLGKVQPGFLMYIPVFRHGMPRQSIADRWNALLGFVYSPYRVEDLMQGILGQRNLNIHFSIYAAAEPDEQALLYRSQELADERLTAASSTLRHLDDYGMVWTLSFTDLSTANAKGWFRLHQLVLLLGISTSILLFLLISFLANENQRAYQLASRMTENLQKKIQELRLSEERFHLALDSSSMGTWNWYLAENVIHWDASIYPLFGLKDDEKLNTYESFLARLHPDDRERVFREIARAKEGHSLYDTEYRVVWPDGSLHFIASRAKVLLDENQQPLLMTGTCWDITEKKRIDKIKDEFVSTVSHELRTPLTSVAGAIGLLASETPNLAPEKIMQLADIARKNIQRLKLLIDDLLDMEKLSAGKMVFDLNPQPILALVKRAVVENQYYAEQYGVKFILAPAQQDAWVNIDSARFLQVMANLLSNAAKFSRPQGIVEIAVEDRGEQVRVEVRDQGLGIAPSAQPYIFEKFYQVDSSATRSKGGTGLGLAITRELVEKMGGNITFTSELGVGTFFFLDFPRWRADDHPFG